MESLTVSLSSSGTGALESAVGEALGISLSKSVTYTLEVLIRSGEIVLSERQWIINGRICRRGNSSKRIVGACARWSLDHITRIVYSKIERGVSYSGSMSA
jgi:hypothetical protein